MECPQPKYVKILKLSRKYSKEMNLIYIHATIMNLKEYFFIMTKIMFWKPLNLHSHQSLKLTI